MLVWWLALTGGAAPEHPAPVHWAALPPVGLHPCGQSCTQAHAHAGVESQASSAELATVIVFGESKETRCNVLTALTSHAECRECTVRIHSNLPPLLKPCKI